ncbi:hypothetical protein EYF80_042163 [Liparis tanakae]|uniref:Uncharacterized protein n=1 Tax=Liparis tanakae TaxID=230148 RepID=A0A4Z2G431_9TELE|nr:hypothetical protein EYF80_042163 [Liparis tanakae]
MSVLSEDADKVAYELLPPHHHAFHEEPACHGRGLCCSSSHFLCVGVALLPRSSAYPTHLSSISGTQQPVESGLQTFLKSKYTEYRLVFFWSLDYMYSCWLVVVSDCSASENLTSYDRFT